MKLNISICLVAIAFMGTLNATKHKHHKNQETQEVESWKMPTALIGAPGLLAVNPETGDHILKTTQALLRSQQSGLTLTFYDCELLAASVSYWNNCEFCTRTHCAAAATLSQNTPESIKDLIEKPPKNMNCKKLRALLLIAQKSCKENSVPSNLAATAKRHGATDFDIYHTVLIAKFFTMYNGLVETLTTTDSSLDLESIGQLLGENGYEPTSIFKRFKISSILIALKLRKKC